MISIGYPEAMETVVTKIMGIMSLWLPFYVDGGKTIQGFLSAGLIQEIIITRVSVLIGSGIPLFGELDSDVNLRHIETCSFDNGFVQSKYEVLA